MFIDFWGEVLSSWSASSYQYDVTEFETGQRFTYLALASQSSLYMSELESIPMKTVL